MNKIYPCTQLCGFCTKNQTSLIWELEKICEDCFREKIGLQKIKQEVLV